MSRSFLNTSLDQSISQIILNFIFGGFQPLDPTVRQCVLSHFGSKEHGRAFASVGLLAAEVLKSVRSSQLRNTESVVSSAAASEEDNFYLKLLFVRSALSIFAT